MNQPPPTKIAMLFLYKYIADSNYARACVMIAHGFRRDIVVGGATWYPVLFEKLWAAHGNARNYTSVTTTTRAFTSAGRLQELHGNACVLLLFPRSLLFSVRVCAPCYHECLTNGRKWAQWCWRSVARNRCFCLVDTKSLCIRNDECLNNIGGIASRIGFLWTSA